ncbi:GNAT family N-acetyltransferase [Janibacter melonis]|uniref:GNAT family N-acetyltransferase n=1 Tax=Janibacter melonis TaxID=262209 RepID=UPI002043158D|nr:GNAT family N-acetyltransferase [Janibacter melonis]MCM3555826.1 GNAT family N-acetyltransferase [Janibacter melonis]
MLAGLPISTRTDIAVDVLGGADVVDHGDHLVVRTPSAPDYHWGNFIQVTTGDPDDAATWLARFAGEFPRARHRAIGLPQQSCARAWREAGLRPDVVESLTTAIAPPTTPLPTGYRVTSLESDADWGARLVAELEHNAETGEHPAQEYRAFVMRQTVIRRRLVADGDAAWFGAFDEDDRLAASLGIVVLRDLEPTTARYQSVLTGSAHRRQGLARHLLGVAARWAVRRGARELVIVAEDGTAAARLYAEAGFTPGEHAYGWYSPGS